jgi:hypothetical protein
MSRTLGLGDLVRVNIFDGVTDVLLNGVILDFPGERTVIVAVPHPSRKYIIKVVTNERVEQLTRGMVTPTEFNEALEFQNKMDSVVDSEGIHIMGRTQGGKSKKRRRRRSSTKRKGRK